MAFPNWRTKKEVKVEDTAKILAEERKNREEDMKKATTAMLGEDYEAMEFFAERAGWPIPMKQTVAPPLSTLAEDSPPSEGSMSIRGPQGITGGSGRALFTAPGKKGGPMTPGDQSDPAALFQSLQARFAANKGLPTATGTMPGKVSGSERLVGGPDVKYPERVGVVPKDKDKPGDKWPRTYYDSAGREWEVHSPEEAKKANKLGFDPVKPLKEEKEKDEKYEARTFYKEDESWKIYSDPEEEEAKHAGFSPIKPGETEQSKKDKAAASKNRVTKLKTMMDTLLTPYRGQDKLIDALLKQTGDAKSFAELAELAKNAYERLDAKSKSANTPEEKERALQVLQRYGELLNRMLAEEGLPPVGGEKPTQALGTEAPTASDYINNALGQGSQL